MTNVIGLMKNLLGFENEEDEDEDMKDGHEISVSPTSEVVANSFWDNKQSLKHNLSRKRSGSKNEQYNSVEPKLQVVNIEKPVSMDEAEVISTKLLEGTIIMLNTTGLEDKVAQRLLDFVSGTLYAAKGDIQEVETGIYVLTPPTVETQSNGESSYRKPSSEPWRLDIPTS